MIHAYAQRSPGAALDAITLPEPAPPTGHDIDVEVAHCSVCHSDVHLLDGDWGVQPTPFVPGHEIVGRVTRRGADARLPLGAIVGIGWQAGACGHCHACTTERVHLCTGGKQRTCVKRQGGFATSVRVDDRFAFELPKALDVTTAAPLLCAGLTVFSPLERLGARAGVRVGVVGVGGLGHLAVRFASALGAEVIAFDPDLGKRDLARSLGAKELVDARGALPANAVDLLLVTTHASLPWDDWMKVLDLEGTLCLIGVPSEPLRLGVDPLLDEQKRVTGSVIGSPATMRRMLDLAAVHGIAPITERMPMSRVNDAIARVRTGAARMRVVLDVGV
jgi:uncharacterized zinc-type alcohol dehydrogenase-like protein